MTRSSRTLLSTERCNTCVCCETHSVFDGWMYKAEPEGCGCDVNIQPVGWVVIAIVAVLIFMLPCLLWYCFCRRDRKALECCDGYCSCVGLDCCSGPDPAQDPSLLGKFVAYPGFESFPKVKNLHSQIVKPEALDNDEVPDHPMVPSASPPSNKFPGGGQLPFLQSELLRCVLGSNCVDGATFSHPQSQSL